MSPAGANGSRPIPVDDAAEEAILGAALYSPEAHHVLATTLTAEDFCSFRNKAIARALIDLYAEGRTADAVIVRGRLAAEPDAPAVEVADLLGLLGATPSSKSAPSYAERIREMASRRRLIDVGMRLRDAGYEGTDPMPILDEALSVTQERPAEIVLEDVAAALDRHVEDQADLLVRSDDRCLLYSEAVNALMAEPTHGKTTVACITAAQVLNSGGSVLYVDFEDIVERLARRLLAVGADRDAILARFHYTRPGPLSPAGAAELGRVARSVNADLIVIDGVTEALTAQDLDEESATDIARWWALIPRPLAATGASVLLIDHVTKGKEGRGRWARGSGHKLAAIDGVAYSVEAIEPFSRHRAGLIKLTVAKDRAGAIGATGEAVALIRLQPHGEGARITWTVDPAPFATDAAEEPGPRLTHDFVEATVEAAAAAIAADPDGPGPTRNAIESHLVEAGIRFDRKLLTPALVRLVNAGRLDQTPRKGGGFHYQLPADKTRQTTLAEAAP